ncbi:MAG: hypothetical protein GOV15_02620 [Candidatus Diapherotrites archaeon]|nr:hypothetical protein [Candidatus Diapherotrites archaeon]
MSQQQSNKKKSKKQTEANKQNAKLSTGPYLTDKTRYNAITHGLLSKKLIVNKMEKKKDFETFKARLYAELQPCTLIEEMMVERILTNYWRLQRVLICEKALIESLLVSTAENVKLCSEKRVFSRLMDDYDEKRFKLNEIKDNVKDSDKILHELEALGEVYPLIDTAEEALETAIDHATVMGNVAKQKYDSEEKKDAVKLDQDSRMALVPAGGEFLDRLTRYETALENRVFRAIRELREHRKGFFVSA